MIPLEIIDIENKTMSQIAKWLYDNWDIFEMDWFECLAVASNMKSFPDKYKNAVYL